MIKKISNILLSISIICLSTSIFSEPNNLSFLKHEIQQYYNSGTYEKEFTQVIHKAQEFIFKEAQCNQKLNNPRKLAIILDIDETSLSNYNQIIQADFANNKEKIYKQISAAISPAITSTLGLYQDAIKKGIYIFFITGRRSSLCDATKINLHRAGYANWTGLYCKPNNYKGNSIIPFKTHIRKQISQSGYTIIASIGDQWSDLQGGYMQKGFKLPNPFYYLP